MKRIQLLIKIRCAKLIPAFALLLAGSIVYSQANGQTKKLWNAPASANALKNPLAGNTSVLKDAKILYVNTCSPCHGKNGKGDGPAAAVQSETDGSLFWKIGDGHTPMPAYKNSLTDNQRWELVNYIRSLAKHK